MMMNDSEQLNLLAGFAGELDPLMRLILASEALTQAQDLVQEVMRRCLQAPYFEHLWGAGMLYAIWGELDDVTDGWPVSYGSNTEAGALREFKRAAAEWLEMPRTESGVSDYTHRWKVRLALPMRD